MFTLIIREIEDNRVFFIAAVMLAVIFSLLFVYQQFYDEKYQSFIIPFGLMISVPLGMAFCAMGATQMYCDKTKKVSALLATLAVNRGHIFAARVIAGFLLVIIGFVPIVVTIIAVVSELGAPFPFPPIHRGIYFEILIPAFLLGFACYCIGLQAGWTSNRVTAILGALGLSLILIPVILIKGFGWEIYAILVLLIAACLIRAWYKFSTAAL
jgi:ABC-type transport system involved in multi-copper enzyme maturation permease subunit